MVGRVTDEGGRRVLSLEDRGQTYERESGRTRGKLGGQGDVSAFGVSPFRQAEIDRSCSMDRSF